MKSLIALASALVLSACATSYDPIPKDYAGPVAKLTDSGRYQGNTTAKLFVLSAIDGNGVDNSLGATRGASFNQGFMITMKVSSRQIPVRPMKVTLIGTHQTAAPIHELFKRATGSFLSVEGTVDFSPKANGHYVVKGELTPESSSVWIEDEETKEVVTEKIVKTSESK